MVRRFHRSIYDELDELKASMDYLYQLAFEPADTQELPPEGSPDTGSPLHCARNAEVSVHPRDVTVTLVVASGPGTLITLELIDAVTAGITWDREESERIIAAGNIVLEQRSLVQQHIVPLPVPVQMDGVRMSLRHGVLDIRLERMNTVLS